MFKVIYFLIVVPVGFLLRLSKHDLFLKQNTGQETYWKSKPKVPMSKINFRSQK
jgi:hypothetical protein